MMSSSDDGNPSYWDQTCKYGKKYGPPVVAAAGGAAVVTVALPAVGFGAGGIAAGSLAAKGMSVAWTTGYGMGVISAAQSAGALGVGLGVKAGAALLSGATAWYYGKNGD